MNGATIEPITEIGEVTANILKLNSDDRVLEREALMKVKRYPTPSAMIRVSQGRV
jgi:hypothetical protein